MGSSLVLFLENMPNMSYAVFSHLINLLSLVGYVVSGIRALVALGCHAYLTMRQEQRVVRH